MTLNMNVSAAPIRRMSTGSMMTRCDSGEFSEASGSPRAHPARVNAECVNPALALRQKQASALSGQEQLEPNTPTGRAGRLVATDSFTCHRKRLGLPQELPEEKKPPLKRTDSLTCHRKRLGMPEEPENKSSRKNRSTVIGTVDKEQQQRKGSLFGTLGRKSIFFGGGRRSSETSLS